MSDTLLISVRFHEGWYHGSGGPPSPARVFQALVAGVGISGPLVQETINSLKWLESQNPPIVGSPHTTSQRAYVNYVPSNDLDAKQGDHRRIGEIRTKKVMATTCLRSAIPFLFAWKLADNATIEAAKTIISLADRIYQLGRAVDTAWAWAELLSADELLNCLNDYPGVVRHPSLARAMSIAQCPVRSKACIGAIWRARINSLERRTGRDKPFVSVPNPSGRKSTTRAPHRGLCWNCVAPTTRASSRGHSSVHPRWLRKFAMPPRTNCGTRSGIGFPKSIVF